tara:strand:- start:657 stop:1643 length:987 start_codon:yes stop_codon:yes gene_type:complete
MKILVTGGYGFIGSNFIKTVFHLNGQIECKDLLNLDLDESFENLEVLNLDNLTYASNKKNLEEVGGFENYSFCQVDIADAASVEELAADFGADVVVHFAAESHVDRSIESGEVFARTNVLGTQVMLDFARRNTVKKFIHISTDEVYGSILEGSFLEEAKLVASSPYSASKAGSDLLALAHHKTYGSPVIVTRCTNNFGPCQHKEKLIPKIIHLAKNNESIPIYGDGKNVRDWIYVKDHCLAIVKLIESGKLGEIYNIGGRNELSNLEIVNHLTSALGLENLELSFVEDRAGHDWRYSVDDNKIRSIGWKPIMSFQEGLAHTVDWYGGN